MWGEDYSVRFRFNTEITCKSDEPSHPIAFKVCEKKEKVFLSGFIISNNKFYLI